MLGRQLSSIYHQPPPNHTYMSLGKTYFRYVQRSTCGVVAAPGVNILYDSTGQLAITGALEQSLAWSIRTGERLHLCRPISTSTRGHTIPGSQVTVQARSPSSTQQNRIAVGYEDGGIRIYELQSQGISAVSGECRQIVHFPGHRAAVCSLAYDRHGALLATGGADCDIVLWDLTAETGLFRLRGHRDAVTQLHFLGENNQQLLSGSKDTLLKVWDMDQQRCVETIVGHRAEVWDFAVTPDETRLVTISSASDMKVWRLRAPESSQGIGNSGASSAANTDQAGCVTLMGPIRRVGTERGVAVKFSYDGKFMGCHGTGKVLEVYKRRTNDEILKKMKRRLKRLREKKRKAKAALVVATQDMGDDDDAVADADESMLSMDNATTADEFALVGTIRCVAKVQAFDFAPYNELEQSNEQNVAAGSSSKKTKGQRRLKILVSLVNNTVQEYAMDLTSKLVKKGNAPSELTHRLELQGHRGDIRSVSISSSDDLVASVSRKMIKVWNAKTSTCVRSTDVGYGLCVAFVPGDQYIICGTKDGRLVLVSVRSGDIVQELDVHENSAIWSLSIRPDGSGFASGGADKVVRFFDFEVDEGDRLSIRHVRNLKMDDEILCVKYSHTPSKDPRKTLIAVATLDNTVKIYFDDSLKFFLSMYGHKLPVMAMDISSDDTLLVTASSDKNVKIWGLDFGDCHKSMFAHTDAIMSVTFVPRTHYFFSASKDGVIKMFDADHFEQVMALRGHHGEVWGLACSSVGDFIVSCSNDRSIRVWERTDEQVFLEEERERELEESFESSLNRSAKGDHSLGALKDKDAANVQQEGAPEDNTVESGRASTRDVANVRAGELLIEALELASTEQDRVEEYYAAVEAYGEGGTDTENVRMPKANIMLLGRTPLQHVVHHLRLVRSVRLNEALLVMPLVVVEMLFRFVDKMMTAGLQIELGAKVLFFLLKTHQDTLVSNHTMRERLASLREKTRARLSEHRHRMGVNSAALNFLRREMKDRSTRFGEEENGGLSGMGKSSKRSRLLN
jgi:U3 small nucleolar RNA-associated protein 12